MSHKHHHPSNDSEILRTEREILRETRETHRDVERIEQSLRSHFPISIKFTQENQTMNPTAAGQSQVFTGTLSPAGATYPTDTTFTITSNDPAVSPSVDSTGLVVSVSYPAGWVESTTTPLAFAYAASSASTSGSLTATITPSAPVSAFPTSIAFQQTT